MNRRQLFNQSWSIMTRNMALWIVALIGLGIGTIVQLVVASPNVVSAIVNALVGFAVAAFTTGALVSMVNALAEGQTVTVSDGVQAGTRWLIPLLIVHVILALPVWIVLILTTGSFLSIFSQWGQPGGVQAVEISALVGAISGVVIVVLLLGMVMSAISVGADRSIVLENQPITEALKRGFQLLTSKLGDFAIIGIMMFVVGLAIAILVGCAASVLTIPVVGQIQVNETFDPNRMASGLTTATVIYAVVGLFIGALLEVLFSGVWTLAFRQWQGKQA